MDCEFMKKRFLRLLILSAIITGAFPLSVLAKEKTESQNKPIFVFGGSQKGLTPFPDDEGTRKIIKRNEIQQEARLLEKQGRYEEAIAKYQQATDPSLLNSERDKAGGMVGIMRIHQKQGKLELALKELEDWYGLFRPSPPGQLYIDKKPELDALIKARDTGSNEPIYAHIENLKRRYKSVLPPKGHQSFVTSQIIRLYDYIGDSDAGIAFIDKVLTYKKLYPYQREEYLKAKQAFMADKAHGTKGRATDALTQSTYFSW